MKDTIVRSGKALLPVMINTDDLQWAVVGSGSLVYENIKLLAAHSTEISIVLFAEYFGDELKSLVRAHSNIELIEKEYEPTDLDEIDMLIIDTGNHVLNEKVQADAHQRNIFVFIPASPMESDFTIGIKPAAI
ncbi:MAG: precorrin-2 dehydrogenase/sirohydrochlorin ferrochelatase family protein, partial [Flavisolibacter sp.]